MRLISKWYDDNDPEGRAVYMTISINDTDKVDVKRKANGFAYVMQCGNGSEVYRNTDDGVRDLTEKETEDVLDFAEKYYKMGLMLSVRS